MIAALAATLLVLAPPAQRQEVPAPPPPAQRGEVGSGAPDPEHASTAPRRDTRAQEQEQEDAEMLRDLELLQKLHLLEHLELFDDERR